MVPESLAEVLVLLVQLNLLGLGVVNKVLDAVFFTQLVGPRAGGLVTVPVARDGVGGEEGLSELVEVERLAGTHEGEDF